MKKIIFMLTSYQQPREFVSRVDYVQKENYDQVHDAYEDERKQLVNGSVRIIGRCDVSEDLTFLNDILINEKNKIFNHNIDAPYLEKIILNEFHKRNIKIETTFPY